MRRGLLWFALTALLLLPPSSSAVAQGAPPATAQPSDKLRVFFDCNAWGCDRDFFVTEIPYIDFIRERADAGVHYLVTSLETGGGGTQYSSLFIGLGRFAGRADTIVTSVPPNSSDDSRRRELARVFRLGIVRYIANAPVALRLRVMYDAPAGGETKSTEPSKDPWNFWVFRLGTNGNFGGESQSKRMSVNGNLSARRTTEKLKLSFGGSGNYRQTDYTFDDSPPEHFILRSYNANARAVWALDKHWSAGFSADAGQSDFSNQKLYVTSTLQAEYNFFEWAKATQSQFVAIYAVGAQHYRYQEETIYFQTEETRPQHQFVLAASYRQPWGSVEASARASQYLHDTSKNNLSISGFTDLRLSRGLSFNIGAFASKVNDQLYIASGGLSRDDVLTQQRALATSYQYSVFMGLSYTFGSLFNNVVNPRLDNLGGGGFFFCCD